MPRNAKKHIACDHKGDRPSRFLVDLNKLAEEKKENYSESKILKNFFHLSYQSSAKISSRKPFLKIEDNFKNWHTIQQNKLSRLTFFPLSKLFILIAVKIIKLLFVLCYKIGWAAAFFIRFIGLIITFIVKFIHNLIKYFFIKFKQFFTIFRTKRAEEATVLTGQEFSIPSSQGKNSQGSRFLSTKLNSASQAIWQRIKVIIFGRKSFQKGEIREPVREESLLDDREEGKYAPKKLWFGNLLPRPSLLLLKPVLFFTFILFILILPFITFTYYKDLYNLRGRVLGISEAAVDELVTASLSAGQFDFEQASENFIRASEHFLKAKNEISEVSGLLAVLGSIIPSQDLKLAANAELILEAGQLGADLGNHLSMAFNSLSQDGQLNIENFLNDLYTHGREASQCARELKGKVEAINPQYLPGSYQEDFIKLRGKAGLITLSLEELVDISEKVRLFLGFDFDKRYLLVFQNNAELRASGGFIGSYALVDFHNGNIKKIEAPGGGSYDTEAGLLERIIAPEPLHLVNPLWHFWDANWWPDWPTSARKLMWFYEKSDGPTVDGIISFTPTFIERTLQVIGSVDMTDNYGVVINAENFWETTQELAEQKEEITNQPKKIIGDLIDKISSELPTRLNKDNFVSLAKVVEESIREKHILFYFNDSELQAKAEELDWDGRVKHTAWDFLMVVNTNIAGGKSDRKIQEAISHIAEVGTDGSIVNTVKIIRTHTGIKNEKFTGVRNVNWMRIYVPQGSQLIEAHGFVKPDDKFFEAPEENWEKDLALVSSEDQAIIDTKSGTKIYNEAGKTVFANWSMVDPGQTITIYLKYKLPFKLEKIIEPQNFLNQLEDLLNPTKKQLIPYALLVQKQPGSLGSEVTSSLKLPLNFKIVWKYPKSLEVLPNSWQVSDKLSVDKYWAVLIEM